MALLKAFVLAGLTSTALAQCGINSAATQLIQGYEKFEPKPYNDGYGFWTVGYGHRCVPNNAQCSDVNWPLTQAAAQQLFQQDIAKYETCLSNSLTKCLNGNQYGALVSWTYNIGCANMQKSTLVRRINNGEDPDTVARQELPKWNKSGGKVSNGLVNRRRAEVNLFTSSSSGQGNCCSGGSSPGAPAPSGGGGSPGGGPTGGSGSGPGASSPGSSSPGGASPGSPSPGGPPPGGPSPGGPSPGGPSPGGPSPGGPSPGSPSSGGPSGGSGS